MSSLQTVSLNIYTNLRRGDHFHNQNEGGDIKSNFLYYYETYQLHLKRTILKMSKGQTKQKVFVSSQREKGQLF